MTLITLQAVEPRSAASRLKTALEIIGGAVGLLAVVFVLLKHLVGFPIFHDLTREYAEAWEKKIQPLIESAVRIEHAHPSIKTDPNGVDVLDRAIAAERTQDPTLKVRLVVAMNTLENLIACHSSFTCSIHNYEAYEDQITQFYFTYYSVLRALRGKDEGPEFGKRLEAEAKRIVFIRRGQHQYP